MKKSIQQIEKIKALAIKKRTEHKEFSNASVGEINDSIDSFTYEINQIILKNKPTKAFNEIAVLAKEEHEYHKERLDWSYNDIQNSLVELSIEIDNL